MKEYLLIRDEASNALCKKVNAWFEESPSKYMFADAKGACKAAVAEYLANQDGYTIYTSAAKRDEYWYQQEEAKKLLKQEAQSERDRIELERYEAQRNKEESEYQMAVSKLTPKELKAIKRHSKRR